MSNPSLFFIGMQNNVYTFPMYHLQACLIRDVISGKKKKQNLLCCLFEWIQKFLVQEKLSYHLKKKWESIGNVKKQKNEI